MHYLSRNVRDPALSQYGDIWDINLLLSHLTLLGHDENLTYKELWMLIVIRDTRRKQALFTISVENVLVVLLPNKTTKYFNQNRPLDPLIYLWDAESRYWKSR